jgi:hypothetical protein
LSTAVINDSSLPAPTVYELPGNTDFLSKPWLRWETRKSVFGGREVQHLYHLGRYAITKLCNLPAEDVPLYDIAEMNLVCAYGLTGKHDIEIESMLKRLDIWARRCQTYISQKNSTFQANPDKFGSFGKFVIHSMVQVLTKQLGVHYNALLDGEPGKHAEPITDPADTFIHGVLGPKRMGTCASLPVVLIALGRRLGYPLKLVLAPEHSFCRWDAPNERFNIEFDEAGLAFHPDEYYKAWPFKWTPQMDDRERKRPFYLVSLNPQQELASFAFGRSYHLNMVDGTRRREALAMMHVAQRLWRAHRHAVWITHLATRVLYPERNWPHAPCEETASKAAAERLVREKGVLIIDNPAIATS